MRLSTFDGGVLSLVAPQLVQPNQGVIYENIDNALRVLTPNKDALDAEETVGTFYTYFNAEARWVTENAKTYFLEYQRKLYGATGSSQPWVEDTNGRRNLGIAPPTNDNLAANPWYGQYQQVTDYTLASDLGSGGLPQDGSLEYLIMIRPVDEEDAPWSAPTYAIAEAGGTRVKQYKEGSLGFATGVINRAIYAASSNLKRTVTLSAVQGRPTELNEILLYRRYDGEWRRVGATQGESIVDSVYDISGNPKLDESKISPFNGTYQYVYTYYNSQDGIESAPSPVSSEREQTGGWIDVGPLWISDDPQVDKMRIYRVGGNFAQFTLIEEIDETGVYRDKVREEDADGRLLETDNYLNAPDEIKYLTESYAMLFAAVDTELRFTPIGIPTAWPPEYSLQFDAPITGIGAVAQGLLVFTRYKTHLVTGTGPFTLVQQLLRGDQGCISHDSIQEVNRGSIIWASDDGLCTSSGNNVVSLTKSFLGEYTLVPTHSAVQDEVYYCRNEDGTVLAWDYRFTPIPKWLDFNADSLHSAQGELFGARNGELFTLFRGSDNLEMHYKSPRYTEGAYSDRKQYKHVYIRSEGVIIINILIDDVLVTTKTYSTKDTHQLQVPQNKQSGYSIQFEITGTGTVHEINYIAEGPHG